MDVDELAATAKQLTREGFVARYPHLFFLFYDDGGSISAAQFATEISPRSAKPPMALAGKLKVLEIKKGPANPYADRISIGRARNCDVVLRHSSVSKLHAHVRHEADGSWLLIDSGSHNGTSVGNRGVLPESPAPLRSGDLVTFGAITVRCVDAGELHTVVTRLLQVVK